MRPKLSAFLHLSFFFARCNSEVPVFFADSTSIFVNVVCLFRLSVHGSPFLAFARLRPRFCHDPVVRNRRLLLRTAIPYPPALRAHDAK